MKKLLYFTLTLALALALTLLCVSAETPDTGELPPTTSDPDDAPASPGDPGIPPSEQETPMPSDTPAGDSTPGIEQKRSFGETVNYIWDTYAGEIFSALTLLISLILAYFYKRGLIPVVWNGIDRIHEASSAANNTALAHVTATEEKLAAFFTSAEPILRDMSDTAAEAAALMAYVKALEARLEASEQERALVREVMSGVADMLWGVFTAANLPAYAKEQIGERYTAITARLKATEEASRDTETADL